MVAAAGCLADQVDGGEVAAGADEMNPVSSDVALVQAGRLA